MSSALAPPLQALLPDAVGPLLALFVLTGGLLGMSIRNMFESIMSEDGTDGPDDGEDADELGGDGLMGEEPTGDDDLGGLGGLDDDGDDLGGFADDEFGDMDGDGGGGDVDELEHRLEELENEVGSLSSTVNTVRNENEQISESVSEVEENVRKLLDIYEMVTRGVNPFADDVDAGMGGGGMADAGSFGLFDDDGGGGEDESVDEDLVDADPDGFFDEDLVEDDLDDGELEADTDVGDVLGDEAEAPEDDGGEFDTEFDDADEELADLEGEDDGGGDAGGTSFADLKEEYESGEADWDDDAAEAGDGADGAEAATVDEADEAEVDAPAEASPTGSTVDDDPTTGGDALADDELFDEVIEEGADGSTEGVDEGTDDAGSTATTTDAATETDVGTDATVAAEADASTGDTSGGTGTDDGGKPYLSSLPAGFGAELVVVEWLEFLVDEVGVRETARAIEYYEAIDWIAEPVAEDLREYLAGFDSGGDATLTIDHHTQSLSYIGQLDGGAGGSVGRLLHGGGSDGIQR